MKAVLSKPFKEMSLWTILWISATILGNPFYNMVAYLIVDGAGFSEYTSTNVSQIDRGLYVLIILIIFVVRYIVYRLIYLSKSKYHMNTFYFLETFAERHKWQVLSTITFFMWMGEVEGNIAGFIFFPLTIFFFMTVSIATMVRMYRWNRYLDQKFA